MIFANHSLKLIFLHVPKCGGSYVSAMLYHHYGFSEADGDLALLRRDDHLAFCGDKGDEGRASDSVYAIRTGGLVRYLTGNPKHCLIFGATEEVWRTYRKFAFVRDPYEKLVSAYTFIKTARDGTVRERDAKYTETFSVFLRSTDFVSNFAFCHAFISQYDHLLGDDGAVVVDQTADFSRIDEELCRVLHESGATNVGEHLRPINSWIRDGRHVRNDSPREFKSILDYYDQPSLDFANEWFRDDFAHFGFPKYTSVFDMRNAYIPKDSSL